MRHFAVLALVPALLLAAPTTAFACGDGEGEVEFRPQRQPNVSNVLLVRAADMEDRADDADAEAIAADRRATKLNREARRLQQRAVQREGVELVRLLDDARQLAVEANESKAHARRARNRAASFRAQARALRNQAAGGGTWRGRRIDRSGFSNI